MRAFIHYIQQVACIFSLLLFATSALSDATKNAVIDFEVNKQHWNIAINDDLTLTKTAVWEYTALTPVGVEQLSKFNFSYHAENEVFDVLEAYVTQPNGQRIPVEASNIFDQDLGVHDKEKREREKVVIFSRLTPGSRITMTWRSTVHKPGPSGVNFTLSPSLGVKEKAITATIALPPKMPLHWGQRGGFHITETMSHYHNTLDVRLTDIPYQEPENNMVAASDVLPMFTLSSAAGWNAIGQQYYQKSLASITDEPAVQSLAQEITGGIDHRIDQARALYNWVAQHINYLSLSYSLMEDYTPHPIQDILRHGYGDCKDQSLLLQQLLKAKGIEGVLTLVNWSNSFRDLPVPCPQQFNHLMVYVPEFDVYLNPVSPLTPFGVLDDALVDKRVVYATETGSTGKTPRFRPSTNSYRLVNHCELFSDGTVKGRTHVRGTGTVDIELRDSLAAWGNTQRKVNHLLAQTAIGGFGDLTHASNPYQLDTLTEFTGEWHSPHAFTLNKHSYITVPVGLSGKHMMNLRFYLSDKGRQFPMVVGCQDCLWKHTLSLPSNQTVTETPKSLFVRNKAGLYTSDYSYSQGELTVTRHLVFNNNVYTPEEYPDFEALVYAAINDERAVIPLCQQH